MRKAFLVVGFAMILASTAIGAATMGPPMALLGEGNWGVGVEYGRQDIDLQGDGTLRAVYTADAVPTDLAESLRIEGMSMNMVFGTLAYGVWDDWDVFVRLGAADAQGDLDVRAHEVLGEFGGAQPFATSFDSGYGFAWGVGTRATFHRWGPWGVGGLAQFTWFNPGDSDITYTDPLFGPGPIHTGEASLDFWSIQLSLAASYQVDTWQFWAGPFVQFIRGDLDRRGDIILDPEESMQPAGDSFKASSEIEEESQIGAHFGARWNMAEQWNVWAEGQFTGDSWLIGAGLVFIPEKTGL